jgi:hypothetical protein
MHLFGILFFLFVVVPVMATFVFMIMRQSKPNASIVIQSLVTGLYLKNDGTFTANLNEASEFAINRGGVLSPDFNNDTLAYKPFGSNKTIGYLYTRFNSVLMVYDKSANKNVVNYISKENVFKFKEECSIRLICRANCS